VLGSGGKLADAFAEVVTDAWFGKSRQLQLRQFGHVLGQFAPQFQGYQAQDVTEIISFVLDALHEDCNLILKKPYIEKPDPTGKSDNELAAEAVEQFAARNRSAIADMFNTGLFRTTVSCPECSMVRVDFDAYANLPMPLPLTGDDDEDSSTTLGESFEIFSREEKLDDADNMWYCPTCKDFRAATRKMDVWSLPPLLVVTLKRIQYRPGGLAKTDVALSLEQEFDFAPFVSGPHEDDTLVYDLAAVVHHDGGLRGGHYRTDAKVHTTGTWHEFNDSAVTESKLENGQASPSAYVLVYRRKDTLASDDAPLSVHPSAVNSTGTKSAAKTD
jgi:ubiquitin C-terminal hydrolase